MTGNPSEPSQAPSGAVPATAPRAWIAAAGMAVLWVTGVWLWKWDAHPADFSALYFAATAFRLGDMAEIYAASPQFFDGVVSPFWSELARAQGFNGERLFPYVYPPLWAALLAPVTENLTLNGFSRIGWLVQVPLVPLAAVLAHRLSGSRLSITIWMAASLALVTASIVGFLAILENQPQILVSLLILLAFERQKSGQPETAGAALALAAAIKLYPAVLVIFWLLRGDRQPVLWFAVFGTLLGAASLMLGGIELHLVFLERVRGISNIVLGVSTATGLDTVLYQLFYFDYVADALGTARAGLDPMVSKGFIAVQPGWFGPVIVLASGTALAGLSLALRRCDRRDDLAVFLPITLIMMSFLAPLSWYYHVLPALLIAPVLLERLGLRAGFLSLMTFSLLTNFGIIGIVSALPVSFMIAPFLGLAAYLLLIVAFWSARSPGFAEPRQ